MSSGAALIARTDAGGMRRTLWRVGQGLQRVPFLTQTLPIVGAFVCSYLLYGRMAGGGASLGIELLGGAVSYVVLFAQLRLIDDLDDLDRDLAGRRAGAARRSALRAGLAAGVIACVALVAALNLTKGTALTLAAAATVLGFAAPFGFKRLFPRRFATGFCVFEGAPLLIFAYGYGFWIDTGGAAPGFVGAGCVIAMFWTGYEFWKFSRKVFSDAMQPYFLSPPGIRLALSTFLVLALMVNVVAARLAHLSALYTIYASMLPLVWLAWMNASWPENPTLPRRRPRWAGLAYVAALELGLVVELFVTTGSA